MDELTDYRYKPTIDLIIKEKLQLEMDKKLTSVGLRK